MNNHYLLPSITRIAPLADQSFSVQTLPKEQWETGDYAAFTVNERPTGYNEIELPTGRMVELVRGDRFIGAFGVREATREGTGTWRAAEPKGRMHALTSAGLMGQLTSKSPYRPAFLSVEYQGHVMINGEKATMRRFVQSIPDRPFQTPTVLVTGTSMSAGKTTVAKIIIRRLKRMGHRVLGAKLTGAGRYRDIQGMGDAGADWIYDFVDVGLPSTVCPENKYRSRVSELLSMMAGEAADVAVVEIGSSPLEPYNGEPAIESVSHVVECMTLAATDPYAVRGVMDALDMKPDFACGPATNTEAGRRLTRELCNVPVLNVVDPANRADLDAILDEVL